MTPAAGANTATPAMPSASDAVVVDRLTKAFGPTKALDGVSFSVAPGELFGFIGPDGAGKTTLFRILATLILADSGTACVLGEDVATALWSLRTKIGYMPGRFSLYPDLTVEENLEFFASVFGTTLPRERDRIAPIYSHLEPFRDRRAAALSGGMKQKLSLCCALVHRPGILFLDEPTTGVDAVSRREFWDLLGRLRQDGLTIIVSTPYMDEATRCGRIALIQRGRLLAVDTPDEITRAFDRPLFAVAANDRQRLLHALRRFPHTRSAFPFGDVLHYTDVRADAPADVIQRDVVRLLEDDGLSDIRVDTIAPSVEDCFIARMGEPERANPREPGSAR